MSDAALLLVGVVVGAGLYAVALALRARRGGEAVVGAESLPANAHIVLDLLRKAHGASAACLVMENAEALWSKSDQPPASPLLDRAIVGATWALGDGRDHVVREDGVIVAAGDGHLGGAVVFERSDIGDAAVEAVTRDVRSLLADYHVDRSRAQVAIEEPRNTRRWLVPDSVEALGFGLCEAAHRMTKQPTAIVVRDPTTHLASVVAVSAGADRRMLQTMVAPSSAAGRACMGDLTAIGSGMKDLLGGAREDRRLREEQGTAFSLRNGSAGVGALIVFGPPDGIDASLNDRLISLVQDAGPVMRRAAAVRAAEQRSLIDDLTGQPNRRALERAMEEHGDGPCSLLCVDIDQFEELRETARGSALRHVAGVFRSTLRDYDVPARLGHEEFALFLPHTPFHHAFTVADRVRVAVGESVFDPGGGPHLLSCSLGVASVPETVSGMTELVSAADDALEIAKRQGRNRVAAAPAHDDPQARVG